MVPPEMVFPEDMALEKGGVRRRMGKAAELAEQREAETQPWAGDAANDGGKAASKEAEMSCWKGEKGPVGRYRGSKDNT